MNAKEMWLRRLAGYAAIAGTLSACSPDSGAGWGASEAGSRQKQAVSPPDAIPADVACRCAEVLKNPAHAAADIVYGFTRGSDWRALKGTAGMGFAHLEVTETMQQAADQLLTSPSVVDRQVEDPLVRKFETCLASLFQSSFPSKKVSSTGMIEKRIDANKQWHGFEGNVAAATLSSSEVPGTDVCIGDVLTTVDDTKCLPSLEHPDEVLNAPKNHAVLFGGAQHPNALSFRERRNLIVRRELARPWGIHRNPDAIFGNRSFGGASPFNGTPTDEHYLRFVVEKTFADVHTAP